MYKVLIDQTNLHYVTYPQTIGSEAIWVLEVGSGKPKATYHHNPIHRNVFVLHYIKTGTGTFNGMKVKGPCAFIMTPNTAHCCEVDPRCDCFDHCWIKISGPRAAALLSEAGFPVSDSAFACPYINQAYAILQSVMQNPAHEGNDRFFLLGLLCRLMALQMESVHTHAALQTEHGTYVKRILKCIHENYNSALSETTIAASVNISKNYMHKVFKNEMGVTPLSYLTQYRIQCAQRLLTESAENISKIGELCGYPDPIFFSYIFKKCCGVTPSAYRKQVSKYCNSQK